MKGKFIVFEGTDGVGKATQTALLAKALRAKGQHVSVFSVPRYDKPMGKLIGEALQGKYGDFRKLDPYLSSIPYMMDYLLAREEVEQALKKGVVIFDRYVESTFAYHAAKISGAKRAKFLRFIQDLAYRQMKLPKPDMIFLLDVPVSSARKLMAGRKKDQFERDAKYQQEVAKVYRSLSKGKEWKTIFCTKNGTMRSRPEIHETVLEALQ